MMSVEDLEGLEETLFWLSESATGDAILEAHETRESGTNAGEADVRAMLAAKLLTTANDAD